MMSVDGPGKPNISPVVQHTPGTPEAHQAASSKEAPPAESINATEALAGEANKAKNASEYLAPDKHNPLDAALKPGQPPPNGVAAIPYGLGKPDDVVAQSIAARTTFYATHGDDPAYARSVFRRAQFVVTEEQNWPQLVAGQYALINPVEARLVASLVARLNGAGAQMPEIVAMPKPADLHRMLRSIEKKIHLDGPDEHHCAELREALGAQTNDDLHTIVRDTQQSIAATTLAGTRAQNGRQFVFFHTGTLAASEAGAPVTIERSAPSIRRAGESSEAYIQRIMPAASPDEYRAAIADVPGAMAQLCHLDDEGIRQTLWSNLKQIGIVNDQGALAVTTLKSFGTILSEHLALQGAEVSKSSTLPDLIAMLSAKEQQSVTLIIGLMGNVRLKNKKISTLEDLARIADDSNIAETEPSEGWISQAMDAVGPPNHPQWQTQNWALILDELREQKAQASKAAQVGEAPVVAAKLSIEKAQQANSNREQQLAKGENPGGPGLPDVHES